MGRGRNCLRTTWGNEAEVARKMFERWEKESLTKEARFRTRNADKIVAVKALTTEVLKDFCKDSDPCGVLEYFQRSFPEGRCDFSVEGMTRLSEFYEMALVFDWIAAHFLTTPEFNTYSILVAESLRARDESIQQSWRLYEAAEAAAYRCFHRDGHPKDLLGMTDAEERAMAAA